MPRGNACIEIRKCPYFADLLDRSTIPRPRHVIKAIREFQCGFAGSTPKVCCTVVSKSASTLAVLPLAVEPPPVVLGHRNLRLLPSDTCGRIPDGVRITSGSKTSLMEFPWMALIAYYTGEASVRHRNMPDVDQEQVELPNHGPYQNVDRSIRINKSPK